MSKESIKTTIDENIYQNGRGLITGIVMNYVLKNIVDNEYGEIDGLIQELSDKASVEISDQNDRLVEKKVNALLDAFADLITKIVFWSGVPYQIPQELKEHLKLSAHDTKTFAYGLSFPLDLK